MTEPTLAPEPRLTPDPAGTPDMAGTPDRAAMLEPPAPVRPIASDPSGLLPLPAPARLRRVLEALAQALPSELALLLAAPRFAAGAAALARLSHPARRDAALRSLQPAEMEWLAEELVARCERVAPLRLPPAVALLVPDDAGVSDRPERMVLRLCAAGISPEWSARWHGAEPAADGASATLTLPPSSSTTLAPLTVRVHVHARGLADGARHVLIAEASIQPRSS